MTGAKWLDSGDLTVDGFDDCILGIAHLVKEGKEIRRVVYDAEAMVAQLTDEFMTEHISREDAAEAANEYLDFNVFQAGIGDTTPIYLWGTQP
jgi:hypothetical protein